MKDGMRATAFETYLMSDDTPLYPMTFQFRYVFQGVVDESVMQNALDITTRNHPLMIAKIVKHSGDWIWISEKRNVSIDFGQIGTPLKCPRGLQIDLQHEPGVRVWCRTDDQRTELTLQVQHACSDGLGTVQFMFDVLAEYHLLMTDSLMTDSDQLPGQPTRRKIDSELLPRRDQIDFSPPEPVALIRQVQVTLSEVAKLLLRQPRRIATGDLTKTKDAQPLTAQNDGASDLSSLHVVMIPPEVSVAYQTQSRAAGVTTNDLFLRDMFVTLVRWAEQHGSPIPKRKWIRLTVPINVRKPEQANMSAANVISYSFLSRRAKAVKDPRALLRDIHEEMEAVKYWRLTGMFLLAVDILHKIRLLRPLLRMPSCFSTIVVSNLGDISRHAHTPFPTNEGKLVAGNLELQSVAAAPPTRAKTHCALVIARYAGQYVIGLQTDHMFEASDAKEFLNLYAAQVSETANSQ